MSSPPPDIGNDVPPEFTGVTNVLGGAYAYACYGGSRLILSYKDTNAGDNYYHYKTFDCTKPVTIQFSTNVSGLDCGAVAAFYMVAMEPAESGEFGTGSLYNDAQGIGFVKTSDKVSFLGQRARTEIDLLETTGRGAQTTLHGMAENPNDAVVIDKANYDRWSNGSLISSNSGASYNKIDMDGIWANPNVKDDGSFVNSMNFGNSSKGDKSLSNDGIDASNPIHVTSVITPTSVSDGTDNYYLKVETTITQGNNSITLRVDSSKPNKTIPTQIQTVFPKMELQNMCFIYSLWAQDTGTGPTYWLDGNKGTTSAFDKRGNCVKADYGAIEKIQDHVKSSSFTYNTSQCPNDNSYFNLIYDVSYSTEEDKVTDDNKGLHAWVLDYQYRGINTDTDAKGWPTNPGIEYKPNPNAAITNWHGAYNYSYLNCQVKANDILQIQPKNIKSLSEKVSNTICEDVFGSNAMSQYNQHPNYCTTLPEADCNFLKTMLVPYKGPSPGPPGPGPGPGPPGPGPSPPSPGPPSSDTGTSVWLILGITIPLVIILIAFLVYYFYYRPKHLKLKTKVSVH